LGRFKIFITLLFLINATFSFGQVVNDYSCSSDVLITEAFLLSNKKYPELVSESLVEYITITGDFEIINHSAFEAIKDTPEFVDLKEKYNLKFSISTFFYLYVGLIGVFIAIVLNFRRNSDRIANGLISGFVFMHSFFLIHLALFLTNYAFRFPHTYSMSTWLSFLYGPVLYFYFKRITLGYTFKKRDILHLLPTIFLIIFLSRVYLLPEAEKLYIMMDKSSLGERPFLLPITYLKFSSLAIYGYLTVKLYINNTKDQKNVFPKSLKPQRIILVLHSIYAITYGVYGYLIIKKILWGWLFNIQLMAMTIIVLYVGYTAYTNPRLLNKLVRDITSRKNRPKYQNSGLTHSLSKELWLKLRQFMEEDKLYRQNNIKLETIASLLGTTRHNASQIINEHSGLNFFELINQYRIEEAKRILSSTTEKLNIIDVAYEVGYNNKVTFNKSFKRFSNLTPSQYRRQLHVVSA